MQCIREEDISWKEFEEHFREKYLSKRYFDCKEKEFYQLKMMQMFDDEYATKFLELLRYIPYLKEEKVKFQRFISGML